MRLTNTHFKLCWKPLQTVPYLQTHIRSSKKTIELRWITDMQQKAKMEKQILSDCFIMFQFYGDWVTCHLPHIEWIVGVTKLKETVTVEDVFPGVHSWDVGLGKYAECYNIPTTTFTEASVFLALDITPVEYKTANESQKFLCCALWQVVRPAKENVDEHCCVCNRIMDMSPPPELVLSDDDDVEIDDDDDDDDFKPPPPLVLSDVELPHHDTTESDDEQPDAGDVEQPDDDDEQPEPGAEPVEKPDAGAVDFAKSGSVLNLLGPPMKGRQPTKERQTIVQWKRGKGGQPKTNLNDWGNSVLFNSFVIHIRQLTSKQQGIMVEGSVWLHKNGTPVLVCRIYQITSLAGSCAAFKKLFSGRYVYVCYVCMSVCMYYYFLCRQGSYSSRSGDNEQSILRSVSELPHFARR